MPTLNIRISEGMKAEIESLAADTGLWESQTEFAIEALDVHIGKYWQGERYYQR